MTRPRPDADRQRPRSLLVVTGVDHRLVDGRPCALSPLVREIELFAELFERVTVAAPLVVGEPPTDDRPYRPDNVTLMPVDLRGSHRLIDKVRRFARLPIGTVQLARAMRRHDATHLRLPDSLGAIGAALAPLFAAHSWAKYAGQWPPYAGNRLLIRAQRTLLRRWFRGPVTVYGDWPGQPAHIVPLFTSSMSREDHRRAEPIALERLESLAAQVRAASSTRESQSLHVLFVGRLDPGKRIDLLIEACSALAGVDWRLRIVGDGPLDAALREQARRASEKRIEFIGAVAHSDLPQHYAWADVFALPSEHEGWPKVLAEAMAYAVPCVSSTGGLVPQMLEGRGIALTDRSASTLSTALRDLAEQPQRRLELGRASLDWASAHCLEDLRDRLAKLLSQAWDVPVGRTSD